MDADTLRTAVIADPDDNGPRLAYADLQEECGDSHRAEFIRVQCALAAMAEDDDLRFDLEKREVGLLYKHKHRWLQEDLPDLTWSPYPEGFWAFEYWRGFVEKIGASPSMLLAEARSLSRRVPFRDLSTSFWSNSFSPHGPGPSVSDVLADWP